MRGGELGFGLGLKKLRCLEVLFKVLPVLSHVECGLYLVAAFDSITMQGWVGFGVCFVLGEVFHARFFGWFVLEPCDERKKKQVGWAGPCVG
jgi:hypothetical protein